MQHSAAEENYYKIEKDLRGVNLNYRAVAMQICYPPYFRPFKFNGCGTSRQQCDLNIGTYIHIWHVT